MTLFALTAASSRGAGKRQVETKFRLSKSKGRSLVAMVVVGDDGTCQVELRTNSREFLGFFRAKMEIEFINSSGQSLYKYLSPAISNTNIFGICLRGRLSDKFTLDKAIVKNTEKLRLTSGRDSRSGTPETASPDEDSGVT